MQIDSEVLLNLIAYFFKMYPHPIDNKTMESLVGSREEQIIGAMRYLDKTQNYMHYNKRVKEFNDRQTQAYNLTEINKITSVDKIPIIPIISKKVIEFIHGEKQFIVSELIKKFNRRDLNLHHAICEGLPNLHKGYRSVISKNGLAIESYSPSPLEVWEHLLLLLLGSVSVQDGKLVVKSEDNKKHIKHIYNCTTAIKEVSALLFFNEAFKKHPNEFPFAYGERDEEFAVQKAIEHEKKDFLVSWLDSLKEKAAERLNIGNHFVAPYCYALKILYVKFLPEAAAEDMLNLFLQRGANPHLLTVDPNNPEIHKDFPCLFHLLVATGNIRLIKKALMIDDDNFDLFSFRFIAIKIATESHPPVAELFEKIGFVKDESFPRAKDRSPEVNALLQEDNQKQQVQEDNQKQQVQKEKKLSKKIKTIDTKIKKIFKDEIKAPTLAVKKLIADGVIERSSVEKIEIHATEEDGKNTSPKTHIITPAHFAQIAKAWDKVFQLNIKKDMLESKQAILKSPSMAKEIEAISHQKDKPISEHDAFLLWKTQKKETQSAATGYREYESVNGYSGMFGAYKLPGSFSKQPEMENGVRVGCKK